MTAIAPMPTVTYRWTALLPKQGWTGTVTMPDCEAALEPVTCKLLAYLRDRYGINLKRQHPIFIWRRES